MAHADLRLSMMLLTESNHMASTSEFDKAKIRAEQTIRNSWRNVAHFYTLGWGGPIESVERQFPFVAEAVMDIRHQISRDLPILFFQTRETPPKDMIASIPFWKDTGNPYNCRLATVRKLTSEETGLYGDFSQAIWFAIGSKMLADPRDSRRFHEMILNWTGPDLFEL